MPREEDVLGMQSPQKKKGLFGRSILGQALGGQVPDIAGQVVGILGGVADTLKAALDAETKQFEQNKIETAAGIGSRPFREVTFGPGISEAQLGGLQPPPASFIQQNVPLELQEGLFPQRGDISQSRPGQPPPGGNIPGVTLPGAGLVRMGGTAQGLTGQFAGEPERFLEDYQAGVARSQALDRLFGGMPPTPWGGGVPAGGPAAAVPPGGAKGAALAPPVMGNLGDLTLEDLNAMRQRAMMGQLGAEDINRLFRGLIMGLQSNFGLEEGDTRIGQFANVWYAAIADIIDTQRLQEEQQREDLLAKQRRGVFRAPSAFLAPFRQPVEV